MMASLDGVAQWGLDNGRVMFDMCMMGALFVILVTSTT
jgi:hypothetical protein